MENILIWLKANWDSIKNIILMIISVCSAICVLTPTPKDDAFFAKVKKVLSIFSIFNYDGSSIASKDKDEE